MSFLNNPIKTGELIAILLWSYRFPGKKKKTQGVLFPPLQSHQTEINIFTACKLALATCSANLQASFQPRLHRPLLKTTHLSLSVTILFKNDYFGAVPVKKYTRVCSVPPENIADIYQVWKRTQVSPVEISIFKLVAIPSVEIVVLFPTVASRASGGHTRSI